MRKRRIIWAVVVIVLAAVVALFALRRPRVVEVKLSDGSVLRVEKVSYGKREPFRVLSLTERWKEKVAAHLPKQWAGKWIKPAPGGPGNWWQESKVHTNTDALQVWLTRRNGITGAYENVNVHNGELMDADGCFLTATQVGGDNGGLVLPLAGVTTSFGGIQSGVTWLTFEAFPRHEKQFQLRLYDSRRQYVGEVVIRNPAPRPKPTQKWEVRDFPITRNEGGVGFILTELAIKTNSPNYRTGGSFQSPVELQPRFKFTERGKPSEEWELVDRELWDSSGDFASKAYGAGVLCLQESAWKLVAKFCGTEHSPSASNVTWTTGSMAMPAPGTYVSLRPPSPLDGVILNALTLAGPGEVVYINDAPVESSVLTNASQNVWSWENPSGNGFKMRSSKPHLALKMGDPGEDKWVTVCAVDDRGREAYATEYPQFDKSIKGLYPNQVYLHGPTGWLTRYLWLDVADDAKTVELRITIHHPKTAEFIFKPPVQ